MLLEATKFLTIASRIDDRFTIDLSPQGDQTMPISSSIHSNLKSVAFKIVPVAAILLLMLASRDLPKAWL